MELRQSVSCRDVNHLLVEFFSLLVGDGPSRGVEYAVGLSPDRLELWTLMLDLYDWDPLIFVQFNTSRHLRTDRGMRNERLSYRTC